MRPVAQPYVPSALSPVLSQVCPRFVDLSVAETLNMEHLGFGGGNRAGAGLQLSMRGTLRPNPNQTNVTVFCTKPRTARRYPSRHDSRHTQPDLALSPISLASSLD